MTDSNLQQGTPSGSGGRGRRVGDAKYWGKIRRLLLATAVAAAGPATHVAAQDAGAPPAADAPTTTSRPSGGGSPAIMEWLNQTLRVRDTVQAVDQPSSDGAPSSRIHAGAEVKAIGVVAGGQWVQIELPDKSLAYLPRAAVELNGETGGQAQAPEHGPETAAPTAPAAAAPEPKPPPEVIRGLVTKVPNAATLVVGERRIRLSGIDPGPFAVLGSFESWLRNQGALVCEPDAQTGRYRCFTSNGVDVAEAAIQNGAGRVGDGATANYREREAEARQARRGLWQGP